MPEKKKYIFDANCFIEPWNKFYSYTFFKPYWDEAIKSLCGDGLILIQREIYDEIFKKDDKLSRWFKQCNFSIIETDVDTTREVSQINEQFQGLVKESKGRSLADPFVIAIAKREKATVVTMEDNGSASKPKIPYVCHALGVRSINLYSFIEESGIKFGMDRTNSS